MALGDVTELDVGKQADPLTGRPVERLSDELGNTHHPYFTQNLCSPDGSEVLVASDRSGNWQLFNLLINDGIMVQVTDEAGLSAHGAVRHPREPLAYFFSGGLLKEVSLDDFSVRVLYALPAGFDPGIVSLSSDGEYMAFAYTERLQLSTGTGRIYSRMKEHLFRRPESVIMYVETSTGTADAIWGEREWISHVNVSPTEPKIVLFCHEGPWDLVQRMWVVDAQTSEVWPLLEQEPHYERAGHEFFLSDGRVGTQYSRRENIDGEWQDHVTTLWPDGTERQDCAWPGPQAMHVQAGPDCELWAGDKAWLPDVPDPEATLCVFRCEEGRIEGQPLCVHETSWLTQRSHVHPFFSPDGRYVFFTSDRGGNCNLYRVPAAW